MSNRLTMSSVALVLTLSAPIAMAADQENRGISASVAADLLYQLENLQYEVSQLRGQVEEQQHEINKMKALQKDRYIDLDRRISNAITQRQAAPETSASLPQASMSVSSAGIASALPAAAVRPAELSPASDEAKQAYQAAYELIKNRNFEAARDAFNKFVMDYPNNQLTGNGHYWLGELALVLGDQGIALVEFKKVVDEFAGHAKVPDAVYKLGIVNDQMGNQALAKEYLQQVINQYGDSNAAKLSTNYLNNMK